jgi:hypothetical protein
MRRLVLILASCAPALLALGACSSDKDRPPVVSSSSSSGVVGSSGGVGDGGQTDASDGGGDGGLGCLPGTYDLDLVANAGGQRALAGKVVFPHQVEANRNGILTIETDTSTLNQPLPFKTKKIADTMVYRVSGLTPAKYIVRVQIDQAQTSSVDESGDLDGFFGGSASAPVLVRQDAQTVDLNTDCKGSVDFGIGVKP